MTNVLTSERVQRVLSKCLLNESVAGIHVEGIVNNYVLNEQQVIAHLDEIKAMIGELPNTFFVGNQSDDGGGWSFLNLCVDKHGEQWTGLHQTQEQLCALAIAAKLGAWIGPREMWKVFPGGVPYVQFYREPKDGQS